MASGEFFGLYKNRQQYLNTLSSITAQASQVATIGLINQLFVIQTACCSHFFWRGMLMDFQALKSTFQVKQCKDFQFGNQLRDIKTPDYAGKDDSRSKVISLTLTVQWQFLPL